MSILQHICNDECPRDETNTLMLENEQIRLVWDRSGNLCHLVNRQTDRDYVLPHYMCRLILEKPGFLEFEAIPSTCVEIRQKTNEISFSFEGFSGEDGEIHSIDAVLTARLSGEDVEWKILVTNRTEKKRHP